MFLIIRLFAIYDKRRWILYVTVPFGALSIVLSSVCLFYESSVWVFFLTDIIIPSLQSVLHARIPLEFRVSTCEWFVCAFWCPSSATHLNNQKQREGFSSCFADPITRGGSNLGAWKQPTDSFEPRIVDIFQIVIYCYYSLWHVDVRHGTGQNRTDVSRRAIKQISLIDSIDPPSRWWVL